MLPDRLVGRARGPDTECLARIGNASRKGLQAVRIEDTSIPIAVLAISGSIAAANAAGLVSVLRERLQGHVVAVLTRSAARFISVETLRYAGGAAAVVAQGSTPLSDQADHIWLATRARGLLVYPASANFIARVAAGLANDLASLTFLASHTKPRMIVPSMNRLMWTNPVVQQNIGVLQSFGVTVEPTSDGLAPDVDTVAQHFVRLIEVAADGSDKA